MEMENVYTMGVVRTATGKHGGSLKSVSVHITDAPVVQEVIRRAGISEEWMNEVTLGKVWQSAEAPNTARCAVPEADLPENTPGSTVNRLCVSVMQTLPSGCQEIWCSEAGAIVAGGTENMGCAPHYLRHERWGDGPLALADPNIKVDITAQPVSIYDTASSTLRAAENMAERFHIIREEQGRFAAESQRRVAAVIAADYFKEEILPVEMKGKKKDFAFGTGEFPHPSITMRVPIVLRPIIKPDGTVVAGGFCGLNDGVPAPALMFEREMKELGLRPLARVMGIIRIILDPAIMGYDLVCATCKIMEHTGMTVEQVDLIELNGASTPQAVAYVRDLGLDPERASISGEAIAPDHPLGGIGTRLIVTLLHNPMRTGGRYRLATLCIGGGQSMATMTEKL